MPRRAAFPLTALMFALAMLVVFVLLNRRPLPAAPSGQPPAMPTSARLAPAEGRVFIAAGSVGAYGSYGEPGSPAWELSAEPELVEQHGGGRGAVLVLRCNCGKVIRLLDHTVDEGGMVSPSLWHDTPECGWHVWARLDGWDAGKWEVASP